MRRLGFSIAVAVLLSAVLSSFASAHPLGNFSVNRYSRLVVTRDEVQLRYVLDLAEIPALQELRAAGIKGPLDAAGRQAMVQNKGTQLAGGAQLLVDGRPVSWSVAESSIDVTPGQAELDTLRISLLLSSTIDIRDGARLEYRDANYPGRAGWHEVLVTGGDGVHLDGSNVPAADRSNELRAYPQEAEQAPLDLSSAAATVRWSAGSTRSETGAGRDEHPLTARRLALDPRADQLGNLLRATGDATPSAVLLALLVAAALGALHALEPGHGKTVVGSYLVGSRGTARHALFLGLTVTITHTIGVYVLGLVTLLAAEYIVPERLYPILGVASGLMVGIIGLSLLRVRCRPFLSALRERLVSRVSAPARRPLELALATAGNTGAGGRQAAYVDVWGIGGPMAPAHGSRGQTHTHIHESVHPQINRVSLLTMDADALPHHYGGAALAASRTHSHSGSHDHHHGSVHGLEHTHDHGHELGRSHGYDGHYHDLDHHHDHDHDHHHDHDHDHDHEHHHDHGLYAALDHDPYNAEAPHTHGWGRVHSHAAPAADDGPVTLRSLLALGVSGGLLPCPAALVVLLAAVSLHNVGLGMLLVAAFSLGLATVLTGLGLLILYGGRILGRSPLAGSVRSTPLARALPALSALAVTVAGVAIAAQAASALL